MDRTHDPAPIEPAEGCPSDIFTDCPGRIGSGRTPQEAAEKGLQNLRRMPQGQNANPAAQQAAGRNLDRGIPRPHLFEY